MPPPSLFSKSTKPAAVEELLDYYFYRRPAVPLIPWFAKLGLTPNQVTGMSLTAGLAASYCFWRDHYFSAGLLLVLTVVLDCSDGMLARYLGRADPLGRIWDGVADTIWVVFMYVAIWASPTFTHFPSAPLTWFMSLAGAAMQLHCGIYDGVKTKYLLWCEPGFSEKNLTRSDIVVRLKAAARSFNVLLCILYLLVFAHATLFARKLEMVRPVSGDTALAKAREQLQYPMRIWSFIGESSHITAIALAACLTPFFPKAMLWGYGIILGPFNLIWLWAAVIWRKRWFVATRVG